MTKVETSPRSGDRVVRSYETGLGAMYQATIEDFLDERGADLAGKVQLVFFSPPFPLNRKKKYGNKEGDEYLKWLADLAPRFAALLRKRGSLVVEIGNAWEPGRPVMSLLPLRSLMAIAEHGGLNVCQQFVCHNPARLPSPAQWVTVERIRVKDSYTHVWWMSRDDKPFADNKRVLREYSPAMEHLLESRSYNAGLRPSGFNIDRVSFLKRNKGSIPPNVLDPSPEPEDNFSVPESMLTYANTASMDDYSRYCRAKGLVRHPARMPGGLPKFFIEMLTNRSDLVLDPFGGSNTTGAIAERLGRRWIAVEPQEEYVAGSRGRFAAVVAKDVY